MTDNTKLHDTALRLCADVTKTNKKIKSYNQTRREHVETLEPILKRMQAAFERGENVGGNTSMKQWCKAYKSHGALTYARVRQILTGKSGHEGKRSSSLTFKKGAVFTYNKRQYRIEDDGENLLYMSGTRHGQFVSFSFVAVPVEEKTYAQLEPQLRKHEIARSERLAHAAAKKVVPRETLIAEGVRIIEKMDGQFTRTIWREESKIPERQIAKHWQRFNDFTQEVIAASFTEEPVAQKNEIAVKLTKARMREMNEIAVDKTVRPPVTLLIDTDTYEDEAKKMIWALHERREALDEDGRKLRNKHGNLLDWTNKEPKALEMKKKVRALSGSAKGCEGAIRAICYGSDDHHESLIKWYEDRIEEIYQTRIAKLGVKQGELRPAAESAKDTLETIAPEHKEVLKRHKATATLTIDAGSNCPTQENEQ
jgi:hypothetical protein